MKCKGTKMIRAIVILLFIMQPMNSIAQKFAEKTNLLYLATTSPNIAFEFSIEKKWTVDFSFGYNPWKWKNKASLRHWSIEPGLRYWTCKSFEGHFFEVHGIYSKYNVGKLSFISSMKEYTYKGDMYGAGISYGYHFPIKGRWGLELVAGFGYLHFEYDKYVCKECLENYGSYKRNYWGPNRIGISLIYLID